MTARERILALRLLEKQERSPEFAKRIGIQVRMTEKDPEKKWRLTMFELLVLVLFAWLLVKSIGLTLRLTWGLAKVTAVILVAMAVPALLICLLVAGGIAILIPVALAAAAFGILKAAV